MITSLQQLFHYVWSEMPITAWIPILGSMVAVSSVSLGIHATMFGRSLLRESGSLSTGKRVSAGGAIVEYSCSSVNLDLSALGKKWVWRGVLCVSVGLVLLAFIVVSQRS